MSPVCIVSGCSRGIGRGIAYTLAKSGYSLGLLSRSEEVFILQRALSKNESKHLALQCDIRDEKSVKNAVARIVSELGEPTGLVNVAGQFTGVFLL